MLNTDSTGFFEWYNSKASKNEKALFDKIDDFGSMFEDMTFQPGTAPYNMVQIKSLSPDSGEWEDDEASLPYELEYFSYGWFHYKVEEIPDDPDCDGYFNSEEQLLCISPRALDDPSILHEMIHLHEFVLNELPFAVHDTLLWSLYCALRKRIPDLDEIITEHAHIFTEWRLFLTGGNHDLLFLLKSFDLDIRMGFPLGTVFAYGRIDDFKKYTYLPESNTDA